MPEKVALTISGEEFRHFPEIAFSFALDNHPTLDFVAPFEPERAAFRPLFRPMSYAPVTATIDDELVFTGTMMPVTPIVTAGERTVGVGVWSKPAKLAVCDVPHDDKHPFQCDGLKLDAIAKHICDPLGITARIEPDDPRSAFGGDPGAPFLRVKPTKRSKKRDRFYGGEGQETLRIEGNVQEFLADLGRQRGFVMSSDAPGRLVFRRSRTSPPVVHFEEGKQPALTFEPTFRPEEFYSEITGILPPKGKRPGAIWTEQNPFLRNDRRTHTITLDDTEGADAKVAVLAEMARMFANVMSLRVTVPTWRDPHGDLWQPNTMVTVTAPSAMVYKESTFLVRDVLLTQTSLQETADLNLVLPGAFSGELPDTLPWLE